MVEDGYEAARVFGPSLLLLDRYVLPVPALNRLSELNSQEQTRLEIITKAQTSCVAYESPPIKKPGPGRPPKKGKSIRLMELFSTCAHQFHETTLCLYGKEEYVSFYCTELLWGQKLYQKLRFVLVEYGGIKSILVSTDCTTQPETIIRLSSYRFKIESCFRELKQAIGCFCYHFWTKSMPRLNHYRKKSEGHVLDEVRRDETRRKILKAVQAVECHVMLSIIAMGDHPDVVLKVQ